MREGTRAIDDLPALIRAFIAQLCSSKFLRELERADGFHRKVDIILYASNGRPSRGPGIMLHAE